MPNPVYEQVYGYLIVCKKRTALHASAAGFLLYQRMGYQPTAYFRSYSD
ncbi:MAG: hypothetical protein KME21_29490 [Desmonostoc vinosum HA7617-LM4]|jgi:hypothetical protein|nr:hypothetical protein [Desmonostoc vinosum HA7617-LM4]